MAAGSLNRGVVLGRAVVDVLEPRRMFAASIGLSPEGILVVEGSERADLISFSLNKSNPAKLDVRVNRVVGQFDVAAITGGVTVRALGGNDRVVVNEKNGAVPLDFMVFAGSGNDRIVVGSGDDVVDGGAGNDDLGGGKGNDLLIGGAGGDKLSGGDGKDVLSGGAGNDKVSGGAGDDDISGGDGNDQLDGGAGDDDVLGGDGGDRLAGNAGDDDLFGDDGKDVITGGAGDDYVSGGDGNDNVRGGKGEDTFDDGDGEREQKDENESDAPALTFDALPTAVKDAYNTRFPTGTLLKLGAEDAAGDDIVTEYQFLISVDGLLHEVKFSVTGQVLSHESQDSDKPLTLADLPAAAREHFATRFPGAVLLSVGGEDGAGDGVLTEYELKFTFQDKAHEVKYDASGRVFHLESEDDGPLTVERLPAAVLTHFNANYPNAKILSIGAEDGAGDGVLTEYKLKFELNAQQLEINYSPTGVVLSLEGEDEVDD